MNKVRKAKFAGMLAWALIACLTMTSVTPTFTAFAAEESVTESVDNGSKDTGTTTGTESGKSSGTSEAQDGSDKSDGGSTTDDGSSKAGAEDTGTGDSSGDGSSDEGDSSGKDENTGEGSGESENADSDADSKDADDEDADSDTDDDADADDADSDNEEADADEDADSDSGDEDADAEDDADDDAEDDAEGAAGGSGSSSGSTGVDEAEEEEEDEEEEDAEDGELEDEFGIQLLKSTPNEASPSCAVGNEEYKSIASASEAIKTYHDGSGTITLLTDNVEPSILRFDDLDITIDLAGFTLSNEEEYDEDAFVFDDTVGTALIYVPSGASLTVTDSEGGGEITTSALSYCIVAEGGTVTIESGTISDSTASDRTIWIRDNSTLNVTGGTINASGSSGIGINAVDSAVTISGGTINANEGATYAIRVSGTKLNITGGNFNSIGNGVYIQNSTSDSGDIAYSKATINGGTITTNGGSGTALGISYGSNVTVEDVTLNSDCFGIGYWGDNDHAETVLTINGGTFTALQIGTSGYHYSNVHLIINGGTFTATGTASDEAGGGFYFPCTGTIDFNGGTLISYSDGITIRDGTLNMTGGYIEANGEPDELPDPDEQTNDNSGGYDGVGILIGQHRVEDASGYDRTLTINISGGEIYGYAYALLENDYSSYNDHQYEDRIHVNISGGIFSSSGALDEHPVDIIDEDEERSAGALDEAHVTGGFFSNHVEESDYIDEGYMCIDGITVTGETEKTSGDNYHAVIPHEINDKNLVVTFDEDTFTFTYDEQPHFASPSEVTIASSSDAENGVTLVAGKHYTVSYADENGNVISNKDDIVDAGTYYVIVTGNGEDAECSFDKNKAGGDHTKQDSLDGSVAIAFIIEPAKQDISYETTSIEKTISDVGSEFTNDLTETLVYGDITYFSSDESVATVAADGTVTIVGAGTATITATATGSDNYYEATAEYTLTVTDDSTNPEPTPEPEPAPGPSESEGALDISITDSTGTKISGVVIEIFDSDGNSAGSFTSSTSSNINVIGLSEGTYTVKITNANGYKFPQDEYEFTVTDGEVTSCTIQATNRRSTGGGGSHGGGGGGGSSTSSGAVYTGANGLTGNWIFNGMLFTFPDGSHPSNQYLIIDGEVYAFWTNGYAISFDHTEYYTEEAIAAQGDIPTATGTWDLCGWWFQYSDGSYPHNGWEQLSYNGVTYWYYFDVDGWMVDGWLNLDGKTYYLDPIWDGWRGHMFTGWNEIDGYWYYFGDDGALYRNTQTPDGYTVDANGRMV